jgi:hypothetical protein
MLIHIVILIFPLVTGLNPVAMGLRGQARQAIAWIPRYHKMVHDFRPYLVTTSPSLLVLGYGRGKRTPLLVQG